MRKLAFGAAREEIVASASTFSFFGSSESWEAPASRRPRMDSSSASKDLGRL